MAIMERVTAAVTLLNDTSFTLTENDILSASISKQCVSGTGFEFGATCSATLNMEFTSNITNRYQLIGAVIKLSIYKGGAWTGFGVYNVTSASRWRNKFSISASDNMIWLDKSIYSTDENSHKINEIASRLTTATTIYRTLQIVVEEVGGLQLAQTEAEISAMSGGNLSTIVFQDITTDCPRDWVYWIAQLLCGFAIADDSGKIAIKQFETSPSATLTPNIVQAETTDVADFTLALVGARMEVWDTTMGAVWYPDLESMPNSVYLDVTDNWIIQGKHYLYGNAMDILDNMATAISTIPYRPFSATIHSSELYHLGQCIQVQNTDGNYYNSVVTNYDWSLLGGQVLKCSGEDTRLLADTKRRSQVQRLDERLSTKIKGLSVNVNGKEELETLASQGKLIPGTVYYDISESEEEVR